MRSSLETDKFAWISFGVLRRGMQRSISLNRDKGRSERTTNTISLRLFQAVFLPEASDFIGKDKIEVLRLTSEAEEPFITGICQAAKQNDIWVSVGLHGKVMNDNNENIWTMLPNNLL
jgi:hypothetical protein